MTKRNSTKRALLASALSLLLCFSMLVGTTFAWFTDSVTSAGNIIKSGDLKVLMHWADGTEALDDTADWKDASAEAIFKNELWEPGYVDVKHIRVTNDGTLALKYQLFIEATGEVEELADVIDVYVIKGGKQIDRAALANEKPVGTLSEVIDSFQTLVYGDITVAEKSEIFTIALKMREDADSYYENMSIGSEFAIKVLATQFTDEEDSFGKDYDAAAPYDLPSGISAEDFGDNVALVKGTFYASLSEAMKAIHANAEAGIVTVAEDAEATVLYLKPGADLGEVTHAHVCSDLTVYGNGAYISSGERDFEVDTYKTSCAGLTGDLTLNIHNLNGVAVWGQRTTAYTVNINLYDCDNTTKVYITGTTGANNINIENCSFGGASPCAVYSNANGTVNVTKTTFKNVGQPINLNHKVAGTQTVNVENCAFVNCGNSGVDTSAWSASIRVLSSAADAKSVLTVKDVSFADAMGYKRNGDILLNDNITGTVSGTTEATIDDSVAIVVPYAGATVNGTATTENPAVKDVSSQTDLNSAAQNGGVVVLGEGNYTLPGVSNKDVVFSGTKDTVISISTPAFHGSDVTFSGVTIQANGTFTGVQHVNTVTYNDATINGEMCLYGEKVVFNNCTFNLTGGQYLRTYGAKEVEFNNCIFNTDGKAILVYKDGGQIDNKITVKGCAFNATAGAKAGAIANQNCAAIEIDNYQSNITLITENNTIDSDFSGEWRIKTLHDNGNTVTVNSVTYKTIAIDGKTMTIDSNLNVTVNE